MMEASVIGLVKTILIVIGILVVLRFVGQMMSTKRNMEEDQRFHENKRATEEARRETQKNAGKISLSDKKKSAKDYGDYTDYEEIK